MLKHRRPVNGRGKVGHVGGSIVGLRRWETVSPAAFRRVDYQPLEGEMDVSSGDVRSGAAGLHGGGVSVREASRVFGLHQDTVRKYAYGGKPPAKKLNAQERAKLQAPRKSATVAN